MTTNNTTPILPATILPAAGLPDMNLPDAGLPDAGLVAAGAERVRAELAQDAEIFRRAMPDPRSVGGLLMVYGEALCRDYTFPQMQDLFGLETLAFLVDAYGMTLTRWEDKSAMAALRVGSATAGHTEGESDVAG